MPNKILVKIFEILKMRNDYGHFVTSIHSNYSGNDKNFLRAKNGVLDVQKQKKTPSILSKYVRESPIKINVVNSGTSFICCYQKALSKVRHLFRS